jgi:hypothetical protein
MRCLSALLVLSTGLLQMQSAMALEPTEADVKAAFIYNFTKFVEWPAEVSGQLTICLLGEPDPLLTTLMSLEGKQSQGRNIHVRNIDRETSLDGCRVIVVGTSETSRTATILGSAQGQTALTVSEIEHFADSGGMIGLVVDGAKVQFEINVPATQHANLRPSAQLLKLARKVKQ